MGLFGWSLPAGCTSLPYDDEEPVQPRCEHCKAFLPREPLYTEPWEMTELCDGKFHEELWGTLCGETFVHPAHMMVVDAGTTLHWICNACGKKTSQNTG